MGMLDQAIQNHTLWRIKLLSAMNGGKMPDKVMAASENQCDLGKWLRSEGQERHQHRLEFVHLCEAHKHFHNCLADTVVQVASGQEAEARQSIFHGTFQHRSLSLIKAVESMKLVLGRARSETCKTERGESDEFSRPIPKRPQPMENQMAQRREWR
jgi:hypothetical protein